MKILVIEDNPISRKMVRVALESEGCTVLEAADGRSGLEAMAKAAPDLVLQDLLLPDMNGFDLVSQLRELPGGEEIPILALTGLIEKADERRVADAPFTDYLFKPLETARLASAVRAHLASTQYCGENPGKGRKVLAIDDEPAQLRLVETHLTHLGFDVATAKDGKEALSKAKSWRPDAILSDVLMPEMDGFQVCMNVRKEPELSQIPVVLVSNSYENQADSRFARDAGANALVARTPDFQEAIKALLKSLHQPPPVVANDAPALEAQHKERMAHQLHRLATLSADLARRCTLQTAQFSMLASVGENFLRASLDNKDLLTDILGHYLNVLGFSSGAIYLADSNGDLDLTAQLGFPNLVEQSLTTFFGYQGLLHEAMLKSEPLSVSFSPSGETPFARLLTQLGARAVLIHPLLFRAERLGVIVLVSNTKEINEERLSFSKAINHQISQAIALNRAVSKIKYLASYDSLTGLPNRNYLRERLQQRISMGKPSALYLINLDRFQEINNTLSYQNGNLLLRQVGKRLQQALPDAEMIARLGADDFGILWNGGITGENAWRVAHQILKTLEAPFKLDRLPVGIQGSIGAAVFPEHGQDPDALLSHADMARRAAKKTKTGYALYSAEIDQYNPQSLAMMGELRHAIEHNELELHYQPKVSFDNARTIGVEALLRWRHPQQGWVSPKQFIPLAEKTGLIQPLSRWVLGKALSQLRSWRDAGLDIGMAVNLSARDLQRNSLPDDVAQLRRAAGMEHNGLTLELTESALLEDSDKTAAIFQRLSEMGVRFSIDDFGTGYSSLSYLKKLPVNEIKIDQSFVSGMMTDTNDATIVRSTIDLGRDLGLTVVAEGVENQRTWEGLAALGCNAAQGYHLCHPLPPDEVTQWMRESAWGVQ